MCLAVPMKVIKIDGQDGLVEIGGVRGGVNLQLVENIKVGDYVIVHAGFAIEKLDEEEAQKTIAMFKEMERMASRC
ncbi:HypC/HybG/HupF family hydrogenase formation chaperone [candidate division KSB1 bacterium]|nr:HypC/HybG/HupF family hydrogenase formation chaperone [candidate division KSB1 bacterium]